MQVGVSPPSKILQLVAASALLWLRKGVVVSVRSHALAESCLHAARLCVKIKLLGRRREVPVAFQVRSSTYRAWRLVMQAGVRNILCTTVHAGRRAMIALQTLPHSTSVPAHSKVRLGILHAQHERFL